MFELTEEALQLLIDKFVESIKAKILEKDYPYAPGYNGGGTTRGRGDKKASGQLYNSIKGKVVNTPNGPVAELYYADYFPYVNRGRKPGTHINKEGINNLLQWIRIRGVRFRNEKGRFRKGSNLSMAFAIERNIFKYGVKPANIYDKGLGDIENIFADFPKNLPPDLRAAGEHLFQAVAEDINLFVEQTIEKEIKSIPTSEYVKIT